MRPGGSAALGALAAFAGSLVFWLQSPERLTARLFERTTGPAWRVAPAEPVVDASCPLHPSVMEGVDRPNPTGTKLSSAVRAYHLAVWRGELESEVAAATAGERLMASLGRDAAILDRARERIKKLAADMPDQRLEQGLDSC